MNSGDHLEMYRSTKSLFCVKGNNSIVGQLYFQKQIHRKKIRFVVTRDTVGKMEGLKEGSLKAQTSNKISKYWGCNVQHDYYS